MVSLNPELEQNVLIEVAKRMCIAARTAPKANGKDFLITAILSGEELKPLQEEMKRYGEENHFQYFIRDAENIEGKVVVLIGTKLKNPDESVESYTSSAVDLGNCHRFSCVRCCRPPGRQPCYVLCGKSGPKHRDFGRRCKNCLWYPLSISGKNPFFDRR